VLLRDFHQLLERLKDHEATDKRLNVAMREMLERGSMPGPDVPLDADTLKISFDKYVPLGLHVPVKM
jgi:hypothetical protein